MTPRTSEAGAAMVMDWVDSSAMARKATAEPDAHVTPGAPRPERRDQALTGPDRRDRALTAPRSGAVARPAIGRPRDGP
ncbi:hypothetical protein Acsp06_35890 [Actinomycetospora sp. NBRC 106375]|nr:hypothetical protein Acsp06_35890 [Actinomycetospora sp. NBRC 106375]